MSNKTLYETPTHHIFLLLDSEGLILTHVHDAYVSNPLEFLNEIDHVKQSKEKHLFGILCQNGLYLF